MSYQGNVCVEEYSKPELVQRFITICNECEHLDKSGDCQKSHRTKTVVDEHGNDYIVRKKGGCESFENNNELKGMLYFAAKQKSLEHRYSSVMVYLSGSCEKFEVIYGTVDYTENLMVDRIRVNLISDGKQIINDLTYVEALEYAYHWIKNIK